MARSTLLETTLRLIRESDEPLADIADGSGVGFDWLGKFRGGRIPNPGVLHVQNLHDYLSLPAAARRRRLRDRLRSAEIASV